MQYEKLVEKKYQGERLDKVLSFYLPNYSRSYIKFLIEEKKVKVNNSFRKPSYKLKEGDIISWSDFQREKYLKTDIKTKIIFQNNDFLIIDKPTGIAVHPKETNKPRNEITILDIIVRDFPVIKKIKDSRLGIVHRLDKDTSGLLIIALNKKTLDYFKNEFKKRRIKKEYLSLVYGKLEPKEGIIEAPISRNPKDRTKMAIVPNKEGKEAITKYKVLKYLPYGKEKYSLIKVFPLTGRTHQIRVHLSSIGHPIVGDKIYGPKKPKEKIKRMFLHASRLIFKTPQGEIKKIESELPEELKDFLKNL